jgi:mycoredoxin
LEQPVSSTDHPTTGPTGATGPTGPSSDVGSGITVYWRPGCPFCSSLFRQLDRAELTYRRVNIWDDETGAAVVRSIARGNETVPTVVVGEVGMVNPSVRQVLAAAGRR